MSDPLRLLWLDDDTPAVQKTFNGVDVRCVQTCADAERHLRTSAHLPDYVVVDLVVPQAGWRADEFLRMPGLQFTRDVTTRYKGGKPKVVVFSVAVTDD